MKPITALLTTPDLEELSSRSNFRYGKEIIKNGQVKIIKSNTFNIQATVTYKNGDPYTAELMSTSKGLRWKCTCTSRKDLFREHCVAVGIFLNT